MSAGDETQNSLPVEMYLNGGNGNFKLDNEIFGDSVPEMVHPRKVLTCDFNNDSNLDIFVAGQGYDKPPWLGEHPTLLLSSDSGLRKAEGLDGFVGFHHGVASADIDFDGDLDIFVTDTNNDPFFLVNDGSGRFVRNTSLLPSEINDLPIYTSELVDVDNDGYSDLLVSGHEFANSPTTVYWGDGAGTYSGSRKTILPAVEGQGIAIDIDVGDLDGDGNKDIVINRTSDEPFYKGFYVQIIAGLGDRTFSDRTSSRIIDGSNPEANWIIWLRLVDVNGDGKLDIISDDGRGNLGLVWLNDGTGRLAPAGNSRSLTTMSASVALNGTQIQERFDTIIRASDTVIK